MSGTVVAAKAAGWLLGAVGAVIVIFAMGRFFRDRVLLQKR